MHRISHIVVGWTQAETFKLTDIFNHVNESRCKQSKLNVATAYNYFISLIKLLIFSNNLIVIITVILLSDV